MKRMLVYAVAVAVLRAVQAAEVPVAAALLGAVVVLLAEAHPTEAQVVVDLPTAVAEAVVFAIPEKAVARTNSHGALKSTLRNVLLRGKARSVLAAEQPSDLVHSPGNKQAEQTVKLHAQASRPSARQDVLTSSLNVRPVAPIARISVLLTGTIDEEIVVIG